MTQALTRIIPLAHKLVRDVVSPGDLTVDLTAGKGQDTLLLFETVGSLGRVLAFDIQQEALENTRQRLQPLGARLVDHEPGVPLPSKPGVYLSQQCHSSLAEVVTDPIRAAVANLGFLPGSDGRIITQPETTLAALRQAAERLTAGGRLIVVVYTGHPGGAEEGDAVESFFRQLPEAHWQVLRTDVPNRSDAPYLLAAQKMVVDAPIA